MDNFDNKKNTIDENEQFAENLFKEIIPNPDEEASKKKTSLYGQYREEEKTVNKPAVAEPIMMDLTGAKDEKKTTKGVFDNVFFFVVFLVLVIALSVLIGFCISDLISKSEKQKEEGTSVVDFSAEDIDNENVAKLQSVYQFIQQKYYKNVDSNALIEGAISGMVAALEDPYGHYYDGENMNNYVSYINNEDEEGEQQPTVSFENLENDIKYIKISKFSDGTAEAFKEAVDKASETYCKGIIIDLRDNPGGFSDEACAVCDIILPSGVVAIAKDKDGNVCATYESDENEISVPVVLLVNENTASAAEIVTGAVKAFGKGEIIGTKTYGKALGQTYKKFGSDGSGIVLSSYVYYTPSGECIDGVGIVPTITIENDDTTEGDEQLIKAVSIISEQ